MLTFSFLNQTLWCYHSLESSRRDDLNEGHIIRFGWEMRELYHENRFYHSFLTVALHVYVTRFILILLHQILFIPSVVLPFRCHVFVMRKPQLPSYQTKQIMRFCNNQYFLISTRANFLILSVLEPTLCLCKQVGSRPAAE